MFAVYVFVKQDVVSEMEAPVGDLDAKFWQSSS